MNNSQRPGVILAICCFALFMVSLDNTIVNVALPTIEKSLHATQSDLQWIVDAYVLVLGSLLLSSGALGDRYGRRRIFRIGLIIFCAGSLACSFAQNLPDLVIARLCQGVGGSMLTPSTLSIVTNAYTDEKERAKAIGLWGATSGMSIAIGPVLGGLLTETIGWRSVFWINLPIGGIAFILATRLLPESRADTPRQLDPIAQMLAVGFLATITYGLIEAPSQGWTSPTVLGCFGGFLLFLWSFLAWERRRRQPLIDLHYFGNPTFAGAQGVAFIAFFALTGFIFFNTLYLQQVRDVSALRAGLMTLPATVAVLVLSPLSGRVTAKIGPRIPIATAAALIGAGLLVLVFTTSQGSSLALYLGYLLLGAGIGTVNPPITNAAVSGMPREQAGVASAMTSTSRQLGSVFGVALLGTLVFSGFSSSLPSELRKMHVSLKQQQQITHAVTKSGGGTGVSPQMIVNHGLKAAREAVGAAFTSGIHEGYLLAIGLAGIALLVGLFVMGRTQKEQSAPENKDDRQCGSRTTQRSSQSLTQT